MIKELYFNSIYVVQSLFSDDRQTGQNLYNDVLRYATWKQPSIKASLHDVSSKLELIELFNSISLNITEHNLLPYLHFEIHGSEDKNGIILNNLEFISWSDLYELLQHVNIQSGNNLFVSMSACFGGYLIRVYNRFSEPCPFRGFIGPTDKIGERDLEELFSDYFNTLLRTRSISDATRAVETSNHKHEFVYLTSETFFDLIIGNLKSFSEKKQRLKTLYTNLRNDRRYTQYSNNQLRRIADRTLLTQQDKIIEDMKLSFLHKKK